MDNYTDFASYLHNPWAFPTKEEQAAMLVFKRKERFVEGYYHITHLSNTIRMFFGDINKLHRDGLAIHYNQLKNYVIENHLIGLILNGTILEDDIKLGVYKTQDNNIFELTVKNICQYLIKEYIKSENVEDLCRKTPNFEIYYK